jgi:hypothetical protein
MRWEMLKGAGGGWKIEQENYFDKEGVRKECLRKEWIRWVLKHDLFCR